MNAAEIIDKLKNESFLIELIHLGLGFLSFFLINLLFSFDIKAIPNYENINQSILAIIIISISYIFSKICFNVGSVLNFSILFVFKKDKKEKVVKTYSRFLQYIRSEIWRLREDEVGIRSARIVVDELKDYKYLLGPLYKAQIDETIYRTFTGLLFFVCIASLLLPIRIPGFYILAALVVSTISSIGASFQRHNNMRLIVSAYEQKKSLFETTGLPKS